MATQNYKYYVDKYTEKKIDRNIRKERKRNSREKVYQFPNRKMNKNDLINDIIVNMDFIKDKEQVAMVKAIFIVKMQGYEIYETCKETLPSTELRDNEFILKRFVVDMLAKGIKESSIKAYINIIKPFFDKTELCYRDVKSQEIIDYIATRKCSKNKRGEYNSQTYIANIVRVLFIFFQWAYRKRHMDEDIMRDVDRVKAKQRKKERLTPEEIEMCREHIEDKRESALFEFMLSTGARVGEITKLKIEDINFNTRKVSLHGYKSDNAEREVYISIKAKNAILKYIGERKRGYVFISRKRTLRKNEEIGTGTIESIAKKIGEKAGAHCITTVHIYRKTFASEMYKKSKSVKLVSILLGHGSTAITEKYYLVDDMKDIEYQALYVA